MTLTLDYTSWESCRGDVDDDSGNNHRNDHRHTIVITDHYHHHHDDADCVMAIMTMTHVGRLNSHSFCIGLRQPCWFVGSHIGMTLAMCSKNV